VITVAQLVRERHSGRADCPVRGHRSSLTVAVRVLEEGIVVVKDHAGCSTRDVLAASGLQWADLFPARTPEERHRHIEIRRERQQRREEYERAITTNCTLQRQVNTLIHEAGEALRFAAAHGLDDSDSAAWDALAFAYKAQRELEGDFALLNPRMAEIHGL
jgi:hypothetical protein